MLFLLIPWLPGHLIFCVIARGGGGEDVVVVTHGGTDTKKHYMCFYSVGQKTVHVLQQYVF